MTDIDLCFAHGFTCEVLSEIPGGSSCRRLFYPGDLGGGQDGLIVRVQPETGGAWLGMFAFGKLGAGVTRVLSLPDPEKLCVVARGAGYVVSTSKPGEWEAIRAIPVVDIRVVPPLRLVLFANYTEILAYGTTGVKWRTKRLAWDGFKIVDVGFRTLVGEYWDIREDATQRFEVDLATGDARGGVE